MNETTCTWTEQPNGYYWTTNCHNEFELWFVKGTPADNNMKFCCYCGKPLAQELYSEPKEVPE